MQIDKSCHEQLKTEDVMLCINYCIVRTQGITPWCYSHMFDSSCHQANISCLVLKILFALYLKNKKRFLFYFGVLELEEFNYCSI